MHPVTSPQPTRAQNVDVLACFLWSGVSIAIIGPPGLGKSATAKAIFRSFSWEYRRKGLPGVTDPILLVGLPDTSSGEDISKIKPYPYMKFLLDETAEGRRNGLIFDDMQEVGRIVLGSLLDGLGEKDFQGIQLPLTSIVATGNPVGGELQISRAAANRIGHMKWSCSPQEQAALMDGDYPDPIIPKFEDNWEDRLPIARREVSGFLRTLNDFDAPDLDGPEAKAVVGAYPSSRSWENFARVSAAIDASDMNEERKRTSRILAAKMLVGDVATNAFFTFLQYPDMLKASDLIPNPRLVLGKEELFQHDRPDRAYIMLAALIRFVVNSDDVTHWKAAWEVLGHFASREAGSVCYPFAVILNKRRPANAPKHVPAMEQFQDVLSY